MAEQLSFRAIHHANRPFQQGLAQYGGEILAIAASPVGQRPGKTGEAERIFIAVGPGRTNGLDLHVRAPVARRSHRALVGAETDADCILAIGDAAQLADIEFAAPAHGGR